MWRSPYTRHLEAEVERLHMELAQERIRHETEERRIRDEARAETEYARRLVASAMLKGGMWNAESATFQPQVQTQIAPAKPQVVYESIFEAAARAQREEQEEFERLMASGGS